MRSYGHNHTVSYRDGEAAIEAKMGQVVVHHDVNHAIYTISDMPLTEAELADFAGWVEATWGSRREVTISATLEGGGSAMVSVS